VPAVAKSEQEVKHERRLPDTPTASHKSGVIAGERYPAEIFVQSTFIIGARRLRTSCETHAESGE
jgi:hypothetical protein